MIDDNNRVFDIRDGVTCADCHHFQRGQFCTVNPPQVVANHEFGQYPKMKPDSPSCDEFRSNKDRIVAVVSTKLSSYELVGKRFAFCKAYTPPEDDELKENGLGKYTHEGVAVQEFKGNPFLVSLIPDIETKAAHMFGLSSTPQVPEGYAREHFRRVSIGRFAVSLLPSHAMVLGAWLIHIAAVAGYSASNLGAKQRAVLDDLYDFSKRVIEAWAPIAESEDKLEAQPTSIEEYTLTMLPSMPVPPDERTKTTTGALMGFLNRTGLRFSNTPDGGPATDSGKKPPKPS